MARPRGYAAWDPKPETLVLIDQVHEVLETYRDYLPMTSRQIFYRLVAAYNYPKTDKDYANLCEKLVRARRAQMISFSAIRDDELTEHYAGGGFADPSHFWRYLRRTGANGYSRKARDRQDYRVEFWTESGGMSEMVAQMAYPFGVPVYSAGGFLSVTATWQIAQRALEADVPTVLLSIGDYDPSGESIFEALYSDALHFFAAEKMREGEIETAEELGSLFKADRVALTWEQVEEHGIETAPPKRTDGRSRKWEKEGRHETAQAEAIDPPLLESLVTGAIEEYTDVDLMKEVEAEGERERDEIGEKLSAALDAAGL